MSILTQPKRTAPSTSILTSLRMASRLADRPIAVLLSEIARIRLGKNRLGLSEYFDYNLFHNDQSLSEKLQFIGWRRWGAIERLTVPKDWWAVFEDKLTLYVALRGLGFPIPELYAIYQKGRRLGTVRSIESGQELRDYLVRDAKYPCFAKPNATGRGVGIALINGYDARTDMLVLSRDKAAPLDDACSEISKYFSNGFLFQELLSQEKQLTERVGPTIGTIRLMTAATPSGPRLLFAAWRIPTGFSIVDNFSQGGNLLGGINIEDGVINRVVAGKGLSQRHLNTHPDTGAELTGFQIPFWDDIVSLSLSCTAAFPKIGLQAWDIAITTRGPVIVEANVAGDIDVPQVANHRGIGNAQFETLISQYAAHEA